MRFNISEIVSRERRIFFSIDALADIDDIQAKALIPAEEYVSAYIYKLPFFQVIPG
jgi:hypothetical protein